MHVLGRCSGGFECLSASEAAPLTSSSLSTFDHDSRDSVSGFGSAQGRELHVDHCDKPLSNASAVTRVARSQRVSSSESQAKGC